MNKIIVDKIDSFEEFVKNMEVNIFYELPKNCRYKWIKIEKSEDRYSKEKYFCWTMEYNYSVAGFSGYIYPSSGNKVTHFKTERGAKRSLTTRYKEYFDHLNS